MNRFTIAALASWLATAAQFVVNVADQLAQRYCGPTLIKETGVPTAPASAGYSEARQASFYKELRARLPAGAARAFAYCAAFDAPWRAQDVTGFPARTPKRRTGGCTTARGAPSPR